MACRSAGRAAGNAWRSGRAHALIQLAAALLAALLCLDARAADATLPRAEYDYACEFRQMWSDKGSGAERDVTLYEPVVAPGYSAVGGYAQQNYDAPHGCVLVLRAHEEGLMAPPAGWTPLWTDEGSGGGADGSLWQGVAPSDDYVCLGAVANRGYRAPETTHYACVHRCMVTSVPATSPIWTDEGSGAHSPVAIHVLPGSNSMVASPTRTPPGELMDFRFNRTLSARHCNPGLATRVRRGREPSCRCVGAGWGAGGAERAEGADPPRHDARDR